MCLLDSRLCFNALRGASLGCCYTTIYLLVISTDYALRIVSYIVTINVRLTSAMLQFIMTAVFGIFVSRVQFLI